MDKITLCDAVNNHDLIIAIAGWIIHAHVDYWMSKSGLTRANSILEFVKLLAGKLWAKLRRPKDVSSTKDDRLQ